MLFSPQLLADTLLSQFGALQLARLVLLVAAKVAVSASASGEEVATAIDAAERRVRAAVPIAKII